MPTNTIPTPTEDLYRMARSGLEVQAERFGLDLSDPKLSAFIDHQVEVDAWRLSEVTWLGNIVNKNLTG